MRARALLLAALLAGCGTDPDAVSTNDAGAALEAAAGAAGLLSDGSETLTGVYARGSDRMCVSDADRVGVLVDYGEGNGCAAAGEVRRSGDTLSIDLGRCTLDAKLDGERIAASGQADTACAALCRGNAGLAGLAVDRVSRSASEAAAFRLPDGTTPCAS